MTTFELLSWGANSHHQLGQGVKSEQCVIPTAVNLNKDNSDNSSLLISNVKKITGGGGHSLLLTEKGEVYSCGWNNKGQTGIPESENYLFKFEKIEELKDEVIVDVTCGWDSSMAMNKRGELFAWGSNAYGQLGVGTSGLKSASFLYTPRKITIPGFHGLDVVSKIAMGLRHSVIVSCSGQVFVAGDGTKGQLGLTEASGTESAKKNVDTFTEVDDLYGVRSVACGQSHTMALTKDGDLYGWGDNKYGQVGFDNREYRRIGKPMKLENINVGLNGEIFAGWTHTAALYDGKILAWGRNSYGQLGRGESTKSETWVPELVQRNCSDSSKFVRLAIGSEHNIALTEDGSIICWGWNEHGNCGDGTDQDVKFPIGIKVAKSIRGTLIGTGYGHSFAVVKYL